MRGKSIRIRGWFSGVLFGVVWASVGTGAWVLAAPGAGAAQSASAEADTNARAKRIFALGREAYVAGRYREAVDAFERVFSMTGHPVMLVNVGNAWARLDEPERATAAFKQYLGLVPDAAERPDLERRIVELEEATRRAEAPVVASVPAAPPEEPDDGLFLGRTWTGVAGVGTVVALGAAWVSWANTKSDYERLSYTCGSTLAGCSASDVSDVSSGLTVTNVALGLATLGIGTATALWFIEAPAGDDDEAPRPAREVVVAPAPFGAVLLGHF